MTEMPIWCIRAQPSTTEEEKRKKKKERDLNTDLDLKKRGKHDSFGKHETWQVLGRGGETRRFFFLQQNRATNRETTRFFVMSVFVRNYLLDSVMRHTENRLKMTKIKSTNICANIRRPKKRKTSLSYLICWALTTRLVQ